MSHVRLNHLAILHVHQAMTDGIDLVADARDFISKIDSRMTTFGIGGDTYLAGAAIAAPKQSLGRQGIGNAAPRIGST